ncbi:CAS/CSE protein [Epithele typhae]|uniref:CAS/CSE protein n=1 Tax=Epithele typhae TaxID=378194 RepID=UPI002007EAD3|nr:CAS/CSE protein [Epithele typhae]KAH9945469.1 CAS/CSE protein [Epithele typhae]
MADLPSLLLASLNPSTRKQAEQNLQALSLQPAFLAQLLSLVLQPSADRSVRLAASVYLKNLVKSRWEDDEPPISDPDRAALRDALVPAMIALSSPTDKAVRAQIAESIALVAKSDFPEHWPDLVDRLVSSLSESNFEVNISILETAHSIFRPWRAASRSDSLFSVINYVLSRFSRPFLQLFFHTASLILSDSKPPNFVQASQAMVLLVDIYYDLVCQDLPPDFEDSHAQFFAAENGLFIKLLVWDPPQFHTDPDDTNPSVSSQIKTGILEIVELYIKIFSDVMQSSNCVPAFVRTIWDLVGGGKRPGVADDGLVSQSLRFVASAIRSQHYKELFGSKETISGLVQGVVVPNVSLREHELEQFEDDPLEYIRLDLALPSMGAAGVSGDAVTRRQAAADVLRALVSSGYEAEATEVTGAWVTQGLSEYNANKAENWRAKDTAIYLLTAVATRGGTSQHGVTSTNALIDVVQFFSEHVFQDLEADAGSIHPVLQVDAIRFLYTFRNQLVKPQLLSVLPSLARHLLSDNYVCCTYAAISIERILFIRQGPQLMFTSADIQDIAPQLLDALLSKIETAPTPEKMAENDYLMKCAMRVILVARTSLVAGFERILSRLVAILGVISKNPSNPKFDQYIFESISALMRFVVQANPAALPTFEQALLPPFEIIISQDIDQYIPYAFQVLAQMLEFHSGSVPSTYGALLPMLLNPTSWQQKGSIPGLVKLLKAFLKRDAKAMCDAGQLTQVLGVVQSRLIPSKTNDAWGFELLQAVVMYAPEAELKQNLRGIFLMMLQRMQTSKTDSFVYYFVYFLSFCLAVEVNGMTPDYVVSQVEAIQAQLWTNLLTTFVIPQAPKSPPKERKVVIVGLTRLLTQSTSMVQEPLVRTWPQTFQALAKLFQTEQQLSKKDETDPDAGLTQVDFEEQSAGYQAAYSRLAAAEAAPLDPVAHVESLPAFVGQALAGLARGEPRVRAWAGATDAGVTGPFVRALGQFGFAL